MKRLFSGSIFAASLLAVFTSAWGMRPALAQNAAFFCGTSGDSPATMINNTPIIIWSADNYFNESGEDALTRCTRVSGILENARQQGSWEQMITTGVSRNGKPIICAANSQDGSCRLLYHVPGNQSPEQARQELLRRVNHWNAKISPLKIN